MSTHRSLGSASLAGPALACLLLANAAAGIRAARAPKQVARRRQLQRHPGHPNVRDPYLAQWLRLTPDRRPAPLQPGVDYGMDPATGQFIWPKATPEVHKGQKFPVK